MNIKSLLYIALGACILNAHISFSAEATQPTKNPESLHFFDDIEDFILEEDDPFIGEFLDTVGTETLKQPVNPSDILNFLITAIGEDNLIKLLTQEFYLHTNRLVRRSPLDQPLFEPDRCFFAGNWIIGSHLFVRKTDRSNFTFNDTNLSSYLALDQPTFLEALQTSVNQIENLLPDPIDVKKIFKLFKNMAVEERQGGLMFHLSRSWFDTHLRILLPFYYFERNLFLNDQERAAVEAEFGVLDEKEQEAFQKAHFVSDKLGFGDTRIELDFDLLDRPKFVLRAGVLATIPTAVTIAKEFKGTDFPEPSCFPKFDLDPLFELAEMPDNKDNQEKAFMQLSDFFLGALDRFASNLINAKLGNDGHFGIGAYLRSKTPLSSIFNSPKAERWAYENRISLEYLTPGKDVRFFINKINEKEFEEHDFRDHDKAEENLSFLEEKVIERIFLRAFKVRMQPGVIFRMTNKLCYQGKIWGAHIGGDWWVQDKEKIREIDAPFTTIKELDIPKAHGLFAWQYKTFVGIVAKHKRPKQTWYFSLNGDVSTNRRGIGHNYGLSFNFEATF